jgi:phosphate starvation-inducible PhoH-like protein
MGDLEGTDFNSIKGKPQRRQRARKQNQKELLNMYFQENMTENTAPVESVKPDSYHYLSQKEKAKIEKKFTTPKNDNQKRYATILKNKNKKIVVATGPAGTGKTLFAVERGVHFFLNGTYEKLIFTRPSVSVDEDLGYLPGNLEEKMAPWIRPIYDILYQFIPPKEVSQLIEDKHIEIAPLGFMRGRTFKNTWIVADEMQNSTIGQMKMLLTRLGDNSRLVITGDLEQHDRIGEENGLEDFLNKFKGKRSSSITSLEFDRTDIQREDVVREVLEIYSGESIPLNYIESESVVLTESVVLSESICNF